MTDKTKFEEEVAGISWPTEITEVVCMPGLGEQEKKADIEVVTVDDLNEILPRYTPPMPKDTHVVVPISEVTHICICCGQPTEINHEPCKLALQEATDGAD